MFSIIIPCYNKAPHIHRSISSVLNQSLGEWELIFVDDASTDSSLEEVRKFEDRRIQVFQREIPGPGGYAARNFGVTKTRFQWICFLDADDEWKPNYLKNLKFQIEKNEQIQFIGSAWEVSDGTTLKACSATNQFSSSGFHLLSFEEFLRKSISNSPVVWTSTACVKKDVFEKINGFPEGDCKSGGDIDTWFRLAEQVKVIGFWNEISGTYHIDSVNMVTRLGQTFEVPCVVKTIRNLLKERESDLVHLIKKYSNKYLLAQIAKSIKANRFNPELLEYFYGDLDWKKNAILKTFKFRALRGLYRQYLEKMGSFYG